MSSYTSRYTGPEIDAAVSFYKGYASAGANKKSIIQLEVQSSGGQESGIANWRLINHRLGKYAITIKLTGAYETDDLNPMVYFVQKGSKLQWWMDHDYINYPDESNNGANSAQIITCYSNADYNGWIVVCSAINRTIVAVDYEGTISALSSATADTIGAWWIADSVISPVASPAAWADGDTAPAAVNDIIYRVANITGSGTAPNNFIVAHVS